MSSALTRRRALVALAVACALGGVACSKERGVAPVQQAAPAASAPFDPVTMDPPADAAHPASMDGLVLQSHGAIVNGLIYEAAGTGPHPTLLMLHGFPGNELNYDLAQAVRRAGWNAVAFHYRGAWGSGGEFSFRNVVEDAASVLDTIRTPEFAAKHRVDPTRVSVFGHSMGGFASLTTGATHPELRCTVSVAGANFGAMGARLGDAAAAANVAATFQQWGTGPIAGISGERLVAELVADTAWFDLQPRMQALADRPILLVAGNADTITPPAQHHEPELAWLQAAGAQHAHELRLDADHAFDGARVALAHAVVGFLQDNCK